MGPSKILIPTDVDDATLTAAGREVRLTNLRKPFWPERGITKGALIQYYADVAPVLLPHLRVPAVRFRGFRRYIRFRSHPRSFY